MIRVVFDTNVYISALLFGGVPGQLLLSADEGQFQLYCSKQIVAEVRGVLRVKFSFDSKVLDEIEDMLLTSCEIVDPKRKISRVKSDPTDNMILECAVEGGAGYIISGDGHLLDIGAYRSIKIISPIEFIKKYLRYDKTE